MVAALFYIIIGIIIARLFWRQLLTVAAWCGVLLLCYLLLRSAPDIGVAPAWLTTMYGSVLIGGTIGVLLGWRIIINFLVERDFDRDVERARGAADKRRV